MSKDTRGVGPTQYFPSPTTRFLNEISEFFPMMDKVKQVSSGTVLFKERGASGYFRKSAITVTGGSTGVLDEASGAGLISADLDIL